MSVPLSPRGPPPGIGTCSAGTSLIALSPCQPDGCGRAAETAKQSENAETQKPFRALRRQADRERKRAACQQATDTGQPDSTVLQGMEYG